MLKLIVNKRINLASLADPRSVAVPVSLARAVRQHDARCLTGVDHVFQLQIRDASFNDQIGWKLMMISDIRRFDAGHRRRFDHVRRMRMGTADNRFLHAIGREDGSFLDIDYLRRDSCFKLAYSISI